MAYDRCHVTMPRHGRAGGLYRLAQLFPRRMTALCPGLAIVLLTLIMQVSPSSALADRCGTGERWNGERCVRGVTLLPVPRDGCQRGYWKAAEDHCCPLGQSWNGARCAPDQNARDKPECPFRTRGVYPNCVPHDLQEPAAERKCGRGFYDSDGHCCPRGTIWNGKRCLRNAGLQPSCPRGTIGIYPDCKEPGSPVLRQPCPSGTTGAFPNCVTVQRCPPGLVGAPPNCRTIEVQTCPGGTRGRYPDCEPIARVCPPGTTGVPPVCRRLGTRPCPPGTVGSPGRCLVLQAPRAPVQPRSPVPLRRP